VHIVDPSADELNAGVRAFVVRPTYDWTVKAVTYRLR
jgi:hypothetical protein